MKTVKIKVKIGFYDKENPSVFFKPESILEFDQERADRVIANGWAEKAVDNEKKGVTD